MALGTNVIKPGRKVLIDIPRRPEKFFAVFHQWIPDCDQVDNVGLLAVVEKEDGTIRLVRYECVYFQFPQSDV